jgi:acetolactate synthase-1/2/3 large subunit
MVDLLRDLGARYLPANPGSSFRGLHDSVVNHGANRDPQFLLCHNEQIAVSIAHGYAKAAQRPGFAAVHDLVGLMQASMGVYNALVDEVPVILLGGGGPADVTLRRPIDYIHAASAQTNLVRDFVKWDAEPMDQVGTEEAIAQAHRISTTAPAGPTYVTLDAGIQEQRLSADQQAHPSALPMAKASVGFALPPEDVDVIARRAVDARSPMIVVGPLGYSASATSAVVALAEALDAAVLDVDHAAVVPSSFGLNLTGQQVALRDADLLIAIGVRDIRAILEPVLGRREGTVLRPALEVEVLDVGLRDLTLRSWGGNGYSTPRVSARFLAEPIAAAAAIAARVTELRRAEPESAHEHAQQRRASIEQAHAGIIARGRAQVQERWDEHPIAPSRLVAELWEVVKDVPWQLAMRNTRTFPAGVWEFTDANDYLGHSGGAGVGYGPGAMVGAALGAQETGRLAIGIGGDGDFLMHPGALWTAARYRIPMLYVINDNRSFFNDEDHQVAVAQDRDWPEENGHIGMRMQDPEVDIAALARGYGAWAAGPIEDPADLRAAFTAARDAALGGATAVVHVRTAPR